MTVTTVDLVGVARGGLVELDQPVQLAGGAWSRWFVDGKRALANGKDLAAVCSAIADQMGGIDAVGGLTMGADHLAHGVAVISYIDWFSVRKEPKGRGTNQRVEGARLGAGVSVLLVDDVVTTGGSIQQAYRAVVGTGAEVVAAVSFVDRGRRTAEWFAGRGIPYLPLVTFVDLQIPEVL